MISYVCLSIDHDNDLIVAVAAAVFASLRFAECGCHNYSYIRLQQRANKVTRLKI